MMVVQLFLWLYRYAGFENTAYKDSTLSSIYGESQNML